MKIYERGRHADLDALDSTVIHIKADGFSAKLPARCGVLADGDVSSSGEATDASIPLVPRMGLDLSYLRLNKVILQNNLHNL
jgi:hypothetical protein